MQKTTQECARCGAQEVRAILNSVEPVCGGCLDSHGGIVPAERIALDRTPPIKCGFIS